MANIAVTLCTVRKSQDGGGESGSLIKIYAQETEARQTTSRHTVASLGLLASPLSPDAWCHSPRPFVPQSLATQAA
ncbi:hypothetical protein M5D96_010116 [Drosophila gunungcola]|uniref:Uncharacterized protein n=1 Tax=Drosophila gunungcola TaxID=103775 RepID=A0A9P9YIG5_9MUSC|nr:hypothetical protein M5D96_010116 [Drosophila gunungcola]